MSDGWTEVSNGSEEIRSEIKALHAKLDAMEPCIREILGHLRQQSIINRMSLPFVQAGESEVSRARAANLALRQKVPFPLEKAKSNSGEY